MYCIMKQKLLENWRLPGLKFHCPVIKKEWICHFHRIILRKRFRSRRKDTFQVLLAHNPRYAKEYADWGADLTFCGHNHGGLIRIPGVGSLISPQFQWFPKYDAGAFDFEGKKVIVSRGLGTHTFHIRIFNRAELVFMVIKPQDIA